MIRKSIATGLLILAGALLTGVGCSGQSDTKPTAGDDSSKAKAPSADQTPKPATTVAASESPKAESPAATPTGAGETPKAAETVPATPIEATGEPGSPSATTTIAGKQLPAPDPKFGGVIKGNARAVESLVAAARCAAQAGAQRPADHDRRRRLCGVASTFGGVIPTPALDRIAKAGLRYTQFHSTALCSPTRAALITGRNHHSAGFGVVVGAVHRLPRLQQHHSPKTRPPSAAS